VAQLCAVLVTNAVGVVAVVGRERKHACSRPVMDSRHIEACRSQPSKQPSTAQVGILYFTEDKTLHPA